MFTGLCQSFNVRLSTLNIRLKVLHVTQYNDEFSCLVILLSNENDCALQYINEKK